MTYLCTASSCIRIPYSCQLGRRPSCPTWWASWVGTVWKTAAPWNPPLPHRLTTPCEGCRMLGSWQWGDPAGVEAYKEDRDLVALLGCSRSCHWDGGISWSGKIDLFSAPKIQIYRHCMYASVCMYWLECFTSISGEKSGKINLFSGPEVQVQFILTVFCMCSLF